MFREKIFIFCTLFVLFPIIAKAQISTNELPVSFSFGDEMFRTNAEKTKTMPAIDLERLRIEDEEDARSNELKPYRFAYSHNDGVKK